MKLDDAVRQAEKLLKDGGVKGLDAAAVTALVELAKRVRRVQEPLRQLERAVCPSREPDAHLNQGELFGEK